MSRQTQVVVLCEDRQGEVFARTFLVKCGFMVGRIRFLVSPIGIGSGEKYVRDQYPRQVIAYRSNRNRIQNSLVVMIDADVIPVSGRMKYLEDKLQEAGQNPRRQDEAIGIFISKRNIETWIRFFMGQHVDEDTDYGHFHKESMCKPYIEKYAENRKQALPDNAPEALKLACIELARII